VTDLRPVTPLNQDIIRGVLILFVLLDHNDIVRNVRSTNDWFLPLTFHVAGFLLLPFLMPAKLLSLRMIRDHATRYLVPFVFALVGYAVAFHVLVDRQASALDWLRHLAIAFAFADPLSLQASTGFVVLWFLPALLSTVMLAALFNSSATALRAAVLVLAIVAHFYVGATAVSLKTAVPQGMLVALYIFPLGLLVRYAMPGLLARRRKAWVAAAAAIALLASWKFQTGREVEIATLQLPTLLEPLWVIATDVSDLSFLILLLICAPLLTRLPGIALLGRYSLLIYLFHPILYKPILDVLLRYATVSDLTTTAGTARYWVTASASLLLVAMASLTGAATVQTVPTLRSLIIPRGFRDWLLVSACDRVMLRRTAASRF
jgi:hypothetical protein